MFHKCLLNAKTFGDQKAMINTDHQDLIRINLSYQEINIINDGTPENLKSIITDIIEAEANSTVVPFLVKCIHQNQGTSREKHLTKNIPITN